MEAAPQSANPKTKTCLKCHQDFSEELCVCPDDQTTLTPISKSVDELVGTTFCERYKIIAILGGGGMGKVYHAQHLLMQRPVAIKILHAKLSNNIAALKRFRVEAQFASSLSHPNILSIHDFGVSGEGNPYMVMDYLEGQDLTDLLGKKTRLSPFRAINIFTQICSALGHAHSKGIIHRDVKPSNIMLVPFENRRDFVKIVDFGIAKFLNSEDPSVEQLTRTGEIFGSPQYMSPEQCRGKELDTRADIYSLGAVMYLALTGKQMFETHAALETMFKHVQEVPVSFRQACPEADLPESLEAVVFKCLAKEPDQRYQRMSDVKEALESVLLAPGVSQPMPSVAGADNDIEKADVDTQTNALKEINIDPHINTIDDQAIITKSFDVSDSATTVSTASHSKVSRPVKIAILSGAVLATSVFGAMVLNSNNHQVSKSDAPPFHTPVTLLPAPVIMPTKLPATMSSPKLPAAPRVIIPAPSGTVEVSPNRPARNLPRTKSRVKRVTTYQTRKTVKSTTRPTGFKRLKNSIRNFLNRL